MIDYSVDQSIILLSQLNVQIWICLISINHVRILEEQPILMETKL